MWFFVVFFAIDRYRYKRFLQRFVLVSAAFGTLVAHGQPLEDEIITTAQGVPQSEQTFSGSLATVDSEQLKLTAHQHVQQVINTVPGVNFHRNDGQEYLPSVRSAVLSGPGACGSILILEDGLPLRPTGFCNVNELFEAHSEQAERIEVLRGPGTALYGSGAMHGVINVIGPAQLSRPVVLGVEGGPDDFTRFKMRGGTDTLALSFTGSQDNGYRDDAGYDQQKISLLQRTETGQWRIDTHLTATNLNQETAGFVEGTDAYKSERLSKLNPNPEAYRDAQSLRLFADISPLNQTGWTLRPYVRYSEMAFLQHFLPGEPLEENGQTSTGLQARYRWQWRDDLQLITGLDLEYGDLWLIQKQDNPTSGSAFLQATVPQGKHYDYQVDSWVAAPYAHVEWQVNETLALTVGGRIEQVIYDYDNRMLTGRTRDDGTLCGFGGCRYNRPDDRTDRFLDISPKFSARYSLDHNTNLYLNLSTGFRAPEVTELYRLQREQGLADLDSEQIDSLELGLKHSEATLSYSLALFAMRKDNVILRDVDFFNVSDGRTTHKGIEAGVRWQFADDWTLDISGTYARHQYDNNPGLSSEDIVGNDEDSAPRHFGTVSLDYNVSDDLLLQLEWQHMGAYYTDPENDHRYPGHDLFHVRGSWQLNSHWQLSAQLNNLLDERYAERADYTSFNGDRYFPGLPRQLYVGIQYQF